MSASRVAPARAPRLAIIDLRDAGDESLFCRSLTFRLERWGIPSTRIRLASSEENVAGTRRIPDVRVLGCGGADSGSLRSRFVELSDGSDLSVITVDRESSVGELGIAPSIVAALEVLAIPVVAVVDLDSLDRPLAALRRRMEVAALAIPREDDLEVTRASAARLGLEVFGSIRISSTIEPDPRSDPTRFEYAHATEPSSLEDIAELVRLAGSAPDIEAIISRASAAARPKLRGRGSSGAKARVLMIQGATSDAGKTFLVTALARHFSNRGLSVAPFKAQNMSNNARVVDGGEIGVAQYFQALAARCTPDVRNNPVLIKPERVGSQVVVLGKPDLGLSRLPWRLRKPFCWQHVVDSLETLRDEHDLILVEGAGSPMETYVRDNDIVNMRVAIATGADVVIAADAARGGAFPHLYGTWALMTAQEKALIRGFILNRFFRDGDATLLRPACMHLESITGGTPVLGTIPEIEHRLPAEDLFSLRTGASGQGSKVAVVTCPWTSNFDEFAPIAHLSGVSLVWAKEPEDLVGAELVILPGSKHVVGDLEWMRGRGLDRAVADHARLGGRVLGVCGGLQMLGEAIDDPFGVEGTGFGLGLLSITTTYAKEKIQRIVTHRFGPMRGVWSALSGVEVTGYEIRMGRTSRRADDIVEPLPEGVAFARENVLGIYLHGAFENASFVEACLGRDASEIATLDQTFEQLASVVEEYLDVAALERLVS